MRQPDELSIFSRFADALASDWGSIARPSQLAPTEDWWAIWLILAGRGWGKTRTGAEWIQQQVLSKGAGRIALIGPTAADVRDVMVEGQSGLLAIAPEWCRPQYEPSKRRLTWPNGAIATTFSAEEPDRLRGPQHDAAWCDELAAWQNAGDVWDMLSLGMRLGKRPRTVVTTTPRPVKLIRQLIAREGVDVVVTRGSTYENKENLAAPFLETIIKRYEGTRLGRQEIGAELLLDVPGAMFQRSDIDAGRITADKLPVLKRVVVAIDPAVSSGENSDETGIIAEGIGLDGHIYILEDRSGRYSPDGWARVAISLYEKHQADRIVAEVNNGGAMVESTLRMVDPSISYRAVHASRGKAIRAEPVAALYEQHRVHHVGSFPALEDQMCAFSVDYDRSQGSPDRLDSLVWAASDLIGARVGTFYVEELFTGEPLPGAEHLHPDERIRKAYSS